MRGALPTTLLPQLPREQYTLAPLLSGDLLRYMLVLQDMYMPPIHGGFTAGDVELDEDDKDARPKRRGRTLSGGSVDLMPPGLGLEMEGLSIKDAIAERADDESSDYDAFSEHSDHSDNGDDAHNDAFEREWAEKWLNGVVRRAQTFIEESGEDDPAAAEYEAVLREATAVLAMMAGTSAAGSLTRHLVFPLAPELGPALLAMRPAIMPETAGRSPETASFLHKLATSPTTPTVGMRHLATSPAQATSMRPPAARRASRGSIASSAGSGGWRGGRRRPAALPVLLHDAPMSDHISVGVQTWGSAILLGREMSLRPADFGLFPRPGQTYPHGGGTRVLELGAGTGLLSILCRKLLDLHAASAALAGTTSRTSATSTPTPSTKDAGLVVATDFHPDVLANLRVCVDLNAPPRLPGDVAGPGIEIAKLDWTTFPAYMESGRTEGDEELAPWLDVPFDLVLASDCVYDPTHAGMLRAVAGWVLRLPEGDDGGGTMHILSPIRPTFTPELESIDVAFPPLESYAPLAERQEAAASAERSEMHVAQKELQGEGLGKPRGLKLGVRGGKRSVRGRKGEGRTDEVAGYWWWEVGWG